MVVCYTYDKTGDAIKNWNRSLSTHFQLCRAEVYREGEITVIAPSAASYSPRLTTWRLPLWDPEGLLLSKLQ